MADQVKSFRVEDIDPRPTKPDSPGAMSTKWYDCAKCDAGYAGQSCTCAPKAADPVNRPAHYTQGKVECIDAIEASMSPEAFRGFCRGNAIKYLFRLGKKGPEAEDARKAQWYINRLVSTYA
jgi:hypothetical protein